MLIFYHSLQYWLAVQLLRRPINNEYDTKCEKCPKGAASLFMTADDEVPFIAEFNEKKVLLYSCLNKEDMLVLPMSGFQGHKEQQFTDETEEEELETERLMIRYLLETVCYGVNWETFQDDVITFNVKEKLETETLDRPIERRLLRMWYDWMVNGPTEEYLKMVEQKSKEEKPQDFEKEVKRYRKKKVDAKK